MNIYKVFAKNIEYYQEVEIEAKNKTEAKEIYQEWIENGAIAVVSNEWIETETKIKKNRG